MERTQLRNNFLRDRNEENKIMYSKQRKHCTSLIRKAKKDYHSNLDIKKFTDNKTFLENNKTINIQIKLCQMKNLL